MFLSFHIMIDKASKGLDKCFFVLGNVYLCVENPEKTVSNEKVIRIFYADGACNKCFCPNLRFLCYV